VKYTFVVGGRTYESQRIRFGYAGSGSQVAARKLYKKLTLEQGNRVPVYYDPSNPQESVLDNGVDRTVYVHLIIGIAWTSITLNVAYGALTANSILPYAIYSLEDWVSARLGSSEMPNMWKSTQTANRLLLRVDKESVSFEYVNTPEQKAAGVVSRTAEFRKRGEQYVGTYLMVATCTVQDSYLPPQQKWCQVPTPTTITPFRRPGSSLLRPSRLGNSVARNAPLKKWNPM
jgi:hypothetical protein